MVTIAQATKELAEIAHWPVTDLLHRRRWLTQAGILPKGKGGRSGAGAVQATSEHLAYLLLSLVPPVAKSSPALVKVHGALEGVWSDGTTITFLDAIAREINRLRPGGNTDDHYRSVYLIAVGAEPSSPVNLITYTLETPDAKNPQHIADSVEFREPLRNSRDDHERVFVDESKTWISRHITVQQATLKAIAGILGPISDEAAN